MRKYQRDFAVTAIAFVLFVGLATTGLVMRFRLPKGSGESLALWGLGRHDWGGVHFWVAVAMLATIALHLFLNWHWIVAVVRGRPRERGVGRRVAAGLVSVGAVFALGATIVLSPVRETGTAAEHELERSGTGAPVAPPPLAPSATGAARPSGGESPTAPRLLGGAADTTGCAPTPQAGVHGTMSIEQVARSTGVPADHLVRQLRLPVDVPRDQPLRELTGAHGFTMEDVRRVVADYQRHC